MTTPSIRKKKRTVNSLIDYWEAPAPLPAPLFVPSRKSVIAFEEELALLRSMQDKPLTSSVRKKKKCKEESEVSAPTKKGRAQSIEEKQRDRQRNEAAREIYTTESTYVHGLETFVKVCHFWSLRWYGIHSFRTF